MTVPQEQLTFIEGRVVHKKSNALKLSFYDGPGDPLAEALQGAGDGKGKKLGVLFGFKNGGTGNHQLTFPDGRVLGIQSRDGAPSIFTEGDAPFATVTRGEHATATLPDHRDVIGFTADPAEPKTPELFRLILTAADGAALGRLDVIRRAEGWGTMPSMLESAWNEYVWWGRAGQPLPVPILGVRLALQRPVEGVERDVLLCASVDMAIGLRPYTSAMS